MFWSASHELVRRLSRGIVTDDGQLARTPRNRGDERVVDQIGLFLEKGASLFRSLRFEQPVSERVRRSALPNQLPVVVFAQVDETPLGRRSERTWSDARTSGR
jgi:hypothetical protein